MIHIAQDNPRYTITLKFENMGIGDLNDLVGALANASYTYSEEEYNLLRDFVETIERKAQDDEPF